MHLFGGHLVRGERIDDEAAAVGTACWHTAGRLPMRKQYEALQRPGTANPLSMCSAKHVVLTEAPVPPRGVPAPTVTPRGGSSAHPATRSYARALVGESSYISLRPSTASASASRPGDGVKALMSDSARLPAKARCVYPHARTTRLLLRAYSCADTRARAVSFPLFAALQRPATASSSRADEYSVNRFRGRSGTEEGLTSAPSAPSLSYGRTRPARGVAPPKRPGWAL
jgi:hypothetical protein